MNNITANPAATTLALNELTVHDLRLAEALGYERTSNIRNLIKRHQPVLETMGSLLQREAMIETGKGAQRSVTEYHLNKAQAAFIIGKSETKRAVSLSALIAEVFAMAQEGRLAPVDAEAQAELQASLERERARQSAINAEEREARSEAFALLSYNRPYRPRIRRRGN